jgi:hypothetical protein
VDAARGIIVLRDGGWNESVGVQDERETFAREGKPEIFMDPGKVPVELRPLEVLVHEGVRMASAHVGGVRLWAMATEAHETMDDVVQALRRRLTAYGVFRDVPLVLRSVDVSASP